jgi:16S rRNA (guanine(527)-N(7))-methyltransferase RsmG
VLTEEFLGAVAVNGPLVPADVLKLLASEGLAWSSQKESLLARHAELLAEWNDMAGLVSRSDLHDINKHYIDSLSLGGIIKLLGASEGRLLDIGSGGGFPAIPLKILLPQLKVSLIERNEKKVGFLHKAVAVLGLSDVRVIHGEFPSAVRGQDLPNVVTSRAVEKPEVLRRVLSHWLPRGVAYLCQYPEVCEFSSAMFHVEQCSGLWTAKGLRRGTLRLIRRI